MKCKLKESCGFKWATRVGFYDKEDDILYIGSWKQIYEIFHNYEVTSIAQLGKDSDPQLIINPENCYLNKVIKVWWI